MNSGKKDGLNVATEIMEDENDKSLLRRSTRSSSKVGVEILVQFDTFKTQVCYHNYNLHYPQSVFGKAYLLSQFLLTLLQPMRI